MNSTINELASTHLLLASIARTIEETKQQLWLYPNSNGNERTTQILERAEEALANIKDICKKNLKSLKTQNRIENLEKKCKGWESRIHLLSNALSKSFRQIKIFKEALAHIDKGIGQLENMTQVHAKNKVEKIFKSEQERELIEELKKNFGKVSSNLDEKFKELEINKGVDICIQFTAENIEENDDFALCGEAGSIPLFTYEDPIIGVSGALFDPEKCDIAVNWQNYTPTARIYKEFEPPKDPSFAIFKLKMLPFPKCFLRLCSTSENLETVSFKIVKITKDGKKFWMEGKNITKSIKDAIPLSNSDRGYDLGVVKFETTSDN